MNLKFLGVGGNNASLDQMQSNMLLTHKNGQQLLLDAGTDLKHALMYQNISNEKAAGIQNVYISHLHSDHAGGMEWLAFLFKHFGKKPSLLIEESLIDPLWNSLKAGICYYNGPKTLDSYFDIIPLNEDVPFYWEGYNLTPVRTTHIKGPEWTMPSFGLFIDTVDVFITTDGMINDNLQPYYNMAKTIFHDCETNLVPSGVHAHYDDLCKLPEHIRNKTWLYHYNPQHMRICEYDGFAGFVQRGQTFEFKD